MKKRKPHVFHVKGERVHAEWHKAPDFAEVAEVLGVPTTQVMAVRNPAADQVFAFFTAADTEGVPDDAIVIYSVRLRRDADGVLHTDTLPVPHPGMWSTIKAQVEAELRREFGS